MSPLQFLKAVLPEPASLAENYSGKTCIGCQITGLKDGQAKSYFIYNVCKHQDSFKDVGSQAISYTTGVPATLGAALVLEGPWRKAGVWNVEQLNPDPFMDRIAALGLPWHEEINQKLSFDHQK